MKKGMKKEMKNKISTKRRISIFVIFMLIFMLFIISIGSVSAELNYTTGDAIYSNFSLFYNSEGVYNNGTTNTLIGTINGTIDDVMIFNTSLNSTQILDIYNNQSARYFGTGTQDIYNINLFWDVTTATYLQEKSVADKETSPQGVFFKPDGTKMYTIGAIGDSVDEYNLSTAWNVTTATYSQEISVAAKETWPTELFFKPDGTKMYTMGDDGNSVDEYNLSTAWNVTTATYLQEISVAAKEVYPTGVFFKPDGTKMYTVGTDGDSVDEYNLSTAWNVTTATYLQEFSVAPYETIPKGVFFKPDGTKMYTVGTDGDSVDEYNLSTAWNVTTATYLQEISISAKETSPQGVFFKPDGTKMYTVGSNGDSVDEYDLILGEYNKVNVSTQIQNNLNSKINLTVGYYDGSWSYTAPQIITNGVNNSFNISSNSTELTFNYTFIAGDYSFYSPIIEGDITYEIWNEEEGGPSDTSFTVSLPLGYTEINFTANNKTVSNLNAGGQNSTISVLEITNTGNVGLDVYLSINQTDAGFIVFSKTNNDYNGATVLNTTNLLLKDNLLTSSSQNIWVWMNWTDKTPQIIERKLNTSVTEN